MNTNIYRQRPAAVFVARSAGVCVVLMLWPLWAAAIESLDYEVLAKHGDVEIRAYESHLLATVEVQSDFEKAGNRAFRDLFNYIDGDNAANQGIAMTAPVIQAPGNAGWRISFVMPAAYDMASLPQPSNAQIALEAQPPAVMAAFTYSGNWSQTRYRKAEQALRGHLSQLGYQACAAPLFARHNPPFWPSFLRKNEVLIPLCTGPRAQPQP